MKKSFFVLALMVCLNVLVRAQTATLNIAIKNSTATSCYLWIPAKSLSYDYLKLGSFDIALNNGIGKVAVNMKHPAFAYLMFRDGESDRAKRYGYKLYLSKGYNLKLHADAANGTITVSGLGSNNNQPLLGKVTDPDTQNMYGDTVPDRILALVNNQQQKLKSNYNQYLKTYKPSADFIKNANEEIKYSALQPYYSFKENNKYQIREAYTRTQPLWQKAQDSLMKTVKLDNSDALAAMSYQQFLRDFLGREKERLWHEAYEHPVEFYRDYYDTDTTTGKTLLNADIQNLLTEKIVNKHFKGEVAAQGYALLIDHALGEHNPQNVVAIYKKFSNKYPSSEFKFLFKPVIDSISKLESRPLTRDMVLLPKNGTDLMTFNDVLALAKGKTVLLDMWGTWCGPCRNEISKNSTAIKAHFKNKGLDYFYVANRDLDHVNEWKKLIAYFDMRGTHILANTTLNKDIMSNVKGEGYPTYVIIKKDGSWELSKAGYPMKRDVLIKQLEAALAL